MNKIEWKGASRCKYKDITAQQNPNAFQTFNDFFIKEKFDHVIEIGTSYGGLSLFLHDQSLIHNFKFTTYDWSGFKGGSKVFADRRKNLLSKFNGKYPFDFRDKNVFDASTVNEIAGMLEGNKCLLLCDGGDKPKEFQIYSKYLTKGSFIMGHDYAPDKQQFNENYRNKIWNWHEISDKDIEPTMESENLIHSTYYNEFTSVAWVQCIKS